MQVETGCLRQVGFAESHAAPVKHSKIKIENAIGMMKAYLKLTIVTTAKQMTSAHAVPRISAKVSARRPASCQANTATNTRKTEKKSPKPTKKSQ